MGRVGISTGASALCIGASQHKGVVDGIDEKSFEDFDEFRARLPGKPLQDIAIDVKVFGDAMHESGCSSVKKYVGTDASGYMTCHRFLALFEHMLTRNDSAIYVLYYAGHGSGSRRGALCMEDGYVSFEDILSTWDSAILERGKRGRKLIIVADSCHSGFLIDELKSIPKRDRDHLNVGIQTACTSEELSNGGVFTGKFAQKQTGTANFKHAADGQHPQCYTTWGDKSGSVVTAGSFHFKFYQRQ